MDALPNPLSTLKREADSIRAVLKTIDENIKGLNNQIGEVQLQKSSLQLVIQAIENEMDRIRIANPIVEQLEFELDPE